MVTSPALPTSSAVVINITSPTSYAGGPASCGQPATATTAAAPVVVPGGAPAPYNYNNLFNTPGGSGIANPIALPPANTNAAALPANTNALTPSNPFQQIQNAYTDALKARVDAENARNQYLELANKLNNMAAANQQQLNSTVAPVLPPMNQSINMPPAGGTIPQNVSPPMNQSINFPPVSPQPPVAQFPQQPPQGGFQPQPFPQQGPMQSPFQPGFPPNGGMMPPMEMNQFPQPQGFPTQQQFPQLLPQQQFPPTQTQPFPGAPGSMMPPAMPTPDLQSQLMQAEQAIASATTTNDKIVALDQAARLVAQGATPDPQIFELFREAAKPQDTQGMQPNEKAVVEQINKLALQGLGVMNSVGQQQELPADQKPGLDVISQVLADKSASIDLKLAALQAIQLWRQGSDPTVQKIVNGLSRKDKEDPTIQRLSQAILNNEQFPAFQG